MGLDMYLKKRTYISPYKYVKDEKTNQSKFVNAVGGKIVFTLTREDGSVERKTIPIKSFDGGGVEITTPVAYWRKANAIHRFFIENCADGNDDCREMTVYPEQLHELKRFCSQVLEKRGKADELLPTQEGFFFGSTDYDEWYYKELEHTVDVLKDIDDNAQYIYEASW